KSMETLIHMIDSTASSTLFALQSKTRMPLPAEPQIDAIHIERLYSLLSEYEAHMESADYRKNTIKTYKNLLNSFLGFLVDYLHVRPHRINDPGAALRSVKTYIKLLHKRKRYSTHSLNTTIAAIRSFYRFLCCDIGDLAVPSTSKPEKLDI